MDFTLQYIVTTILVLLLGLSAGLCFTWTNAVTPGIGQLNDLGYLSAFKHMNRSIVNPFFILVFFGPFFLNIINLYLFRNTSSTIIWLLIIAGVIYFLGVVLVTVLGNVPLNELLDKTDLTSASIEDLIAIRKTFEAKWNQFHFIRTLASTVSFFLQIITLTQISKTSI